MRKAKASLIASIAIGLLAVSTAGVSTYAWFYATGSVSIGEIGSSTKINVNKPSNEYSYFAYRGNRNLNHVPGETDIDEDGKFNFSDDFVTLSNSTVSSETNLETLGFYPGRSFSFCVKVNGLTSGVSSVSFSTTKVISNDAVKQGGGLLHRYVQGTDNQEINVGWAINIHAKIVNSDTVKNTDYVDFVGDDPDSEEYLNKYEDKFAFSKSSTGLYDYKKLEDAGDNNVMDLSLPLVEPTVAQASSVCIFYRISFSKADSTLYKEVDESGDYLIEPPVTGDRLFVNYPGGSKDGYTSNCYANLRFALMELSVDID